MKLLLSLLLGSISSVQAAPLEGRLEVALRAAPQVATVPVQWAGQLQADMGALLEQSELYQERRWGSLTFHRLQFRAPACLALDTTVQAWPLHDRLTWQLCSTPEGALRLDIAKAWLPQALLRNKLQAALTQALAAQSLHLPLAFAADGTLQINGQQLALRTTAGSVRLPLNPPRWQISPQRIVLTAIDQISAQSKAPLRLAVQAQGNGNFSALNGTWGLQLKAFLDAATVATVRSGEKALADWVTAATGQAMGQGQWQTSPRPKLQGTLQLAIPQAHLGAQSWAAASYPIGVKLEPGPLGWQMGLEPRYPKRKAPPEPLFSPNSAVPIIDGIQYFPVMLRAIAAARHSIELESYMFYPGKTTRQLARALCLKAAGLSQQAGRLAPDPRSPQGMPVQIIHHHGMNVAGAREVATLFAEVERSLAQEMAEDPDVQMRIRRNLTIRALPPGVTQIDHRKLLVIDGRLGFTGGLNLGDHYLTADAFHDLMVQVEGPVVAQLQQYFQRNWLALGGTPLGKQWPTLKAPAGPVAQMAAVATDAQDWSALDAILTVIGQAQKQIRLEHAYVHFAPVQTALKAALHRGVKIELMVPETSDETPFDVLNAVAARDLIAAAPQAGRVKVWLYQGRPGQHTYMAHSKYLSADGQQAVVGSTNLVARSLWSPFYVPGSQQQVLFNQEIGLWIRDPALVKQLDQVLLERDRAVSRPVDDFALLQLIQRRGGASRVILEQLKAFLS